MHDTMILQGTLSFTETDLRACLASPNIRRIPEIMFCRILMFIDPVLYTRYHGFYPRDPRPCIKYHIFCGLFGALGPVSRRL